MCRSSSLSYLSCLPSVRVCVVTRAKARSGSAVNHIQKDRENLIVCFLGSDFGAVWHSCVYKITPGCLLFLLRKTRVYPDTAVCKCCVCSYHVSDRHIHSAETQKEVSGLCILLFRTCASCWRGSRGKLIHKTRRNPVVRIGKRPAEIHHFPYACMT